MTAHIEPVETAYDWEREEARDAERHIDTGWCYRHEMRPDGRGGGECRCGATLSRDEL